MLPGKLLREANSGHGVQVAGVREPCDASCKSFEVSGFPDSFVSQLGDHLTHPPTRLVRETRGPVSGVLPWKENPVGSPAHSPYSSRLQRARQVPRNRVTR